MVVIFILGIVLTIFVGIFVFERFYVYAPRSYTYDIRGWYIRYQLVLYGLMFNSLMA